MNILFLSQRVPYPPHKGDKLRAYHMLKLLSKKHRISLVCLADCDEDLKHKEELLKFCHEVNIYRIYPFIQHLRCLLALLKGLPMTLQNFYSASLLDKVHHCLSEKDFDLVYVYCSSMAQYVLKDRRVRKIIDFVDADADKWASYAKFARAPMSLIYRFEEMALRRFERKLNEVFDFGFVVSQEERSSIMRHIDRMPVHVIPNGVDLEYFSCQTTGKEALIVFTGTLDYFPNVDAVLYFSENIWPIIRKHEPGLRFRIIGRNPLRRIKKLDGRHGVEICANVPDVRSWMSSALVSVAPMRLGRGIQNKVLEACALGIPVVCSSVALEGLVFRENEEVLVSDDPQDFAMKVVKLVREPQWAKDFSLKARKRIEEDYQWEKNFAFLDKMIDQAS